MVPKVLCACEESQAVAIEMRNIGIEAYSCDLEPCGGVIQSGIYSKTLFLC